MSLSVSRKRSLRSLSLVVMARSLRETDLTVGCPRVSTSPHDQCSGAFKRKAVGATRCGGCSGPASTRRFTALSHASSKVGALGLGENYHERCSVTPFDRARP